MDISSVANPSVLGSLSLPDQINGIAVSGDFAFVTANGAGLRVIDLRDLRHLVEVGHLDIVAWGGLALTGHLALVLSGSTFSDRVLTVVDVSQPALPRTLATWRGSGPPKGVAAQGSYAYVGIQGHIDYEGFLATVDISDPLHPAQTSVLDAGEAVNGIALLGNLLVGGLVVADLTDPARPRRIGWFTANFGLQDVIVGGLVLDAGGSALRVISLADPSLPVVIGSGATVDRAEGVAVTGQSVLVADRAGGLWFFDVSGCETNGCSLSCTPVVPASAVAGTTAAFQGAYMQSGCSGTPMFDWDFGDGSSHSSEQSPAHTYPFGGTFRWSVAVTLGGASCTTGGSISVASTLTPITSPGAYAYVVPTSAHKDGFNGTHWVTDLVLTNPGLADTVARLYFMKGWRDNSGSPAHPVIVPLRRSLKLTDVVEATFFDSNASGAILVGSDVPLLVTSRTYNETAAGTYGQYVEGVPVGQAFGPGATAWLTGLAQSVTDTMGFRTNVGVVNAGGQHVQVEIALYGGDGIWLGSRTVDVNPYDFQQVDKIFAGLAPSGVDSGYALLSTSTPGAVLFAYASVIDNSTGDPIAVPARVPPTVP